MDTQSRTLIFPFRQDRKTLFVLFNTLVFSHTFSKEKSTAKSERLFQTQIFFIRPLWVCEPTYRKYKDYAKPHDYTWEKSKMARSGGPSRLAYNHIAGKFGPWKCRKCSQWSATSRSMFTISLSRRRKSSAVIFYHDDLKPAREKLVKFRIRLEVVCTRSCSLGYLERSSFWSCIWYTNRTYVNSIPEICEETAVSITLAYRRQVRSKIGRKNAHRNYKVPRHVEESTDSQSDSGSLKTGCESSADVFIFLRFAVQMHFVQQRWRCVGLNQRCGENWLAPVVHRILATYKIFTLGPSRSSSVLVWIEISACVTKSSMHRH